MHFLVHFLEMHDFLAVLKSSSKSSAEPASERATHEREGEEQTEQAATEKRARSTRLVGSVEPTT